MTRKFSFVSVAALAALPIPFACGGDDDGRHVVTHDASMGSNAVDAPAAGCLIGSALAPSFGSDNQFADEWPEDADPMFTPHHIYFDGLLNDDQATDDLLIDLVQGFGVFAGSGADIQTGTFSLAGDDTKYSTCGACVYLAADWGDNGPADFYFAQSGVLELTSVAGNLVGTITNVTFARVGYDEDMNWAGDTVIGDCTSHIDSASFNVPIDVHTGSGSAAALGKVRVKTNRRALHHRYF